MAFIYLITCSLDGRQYVGKTEKFSIEERFRQHISASRKQKLTTHIHRAIKMYGEENFSVSLLEVVTNSEHIDDREKFYISKLSPKFNMTKGGDGGSTTHNRMWINNKIENRYILKDDIIPEGWVRGRLCKFNDPVFQKEMSSRSDRKKAAESTKRAWAEGRVNRDHSKCGSKGDKNPSKRKEVREKISNALKASWERKKLNDTNTSI